MVPPKREAGVMRKLARIAFLGAILGVVVAIAFNSYWRLLELNRAWDLNSWVQQVVIAIQILFWPSSIIAIAEQPDRSDATTYFLIAASLNAVMYAGVGAIGWYGWMRSRTVLVGLVVVVLFAWYHLFSF